MTFSFGSTAKPSTPTPAFSFGNNTATTAAKSSFSFGTSTSKPATTTTPTTKSAFSFGGTGLGGTTGASTGTSTGFSFGGSSATATAGSKSAFSFGGFGSSTQNQQQNQQPKADVLKPEDYKDQLAMALTCPQIFGDERDAIIAKWNQLQAAWGQGKAYRHNNMDPIKLTERNIFCRFKAIGYSRMPDSRDKDGLVHLQIDKPADNVRGAQKDFVGFLQNLLGNKLNLVIKVDGISELPENKCEMAIYIQEQLNMSAGNAPTPNDTFRVPTSILYSNLLQLEDKLKAAGVSAIKNRVAMTDDEINRYLDAPPPGVSEIQWDNAKKYNPDKEKLIPVPLLGFEQLANQHTHQRLLCDQQLASIEKIKSKVASLNEKAAERNQRLHKYRETSNELKRKLLRLICRQELARQAGVEGLSRDEEVLLSGVEYIQTRVKTQVRPVERLSDIKSHMKMAPSSSLLDTGNSNCQTSASSAKSSQINLQAISCSSANLSTVILPNLDDPDSQICLDDSEAGLSESRLQQDNRALLDKDAEQHLLAVLGKQQSQLNAISALIGNDMADLKLINEDILSE